MMSQTIVVPSEGEVREAVLKIARAKMKNLVEDVVVEDDVDLDGASCLRITLVLKSAASLRSRGQQLNEISQEIADFLQAHGDNRWPFTHYATRADFEEAAALND